MSLKKHWWYFLNLFYVFTFCTYNGMILNIRGESIDKKYQKIKQEKKFKQKSGAKPRRWNTCWKSEEVQKQLSAFFL